MDSWHTFAHVVGLLYLEGRVSYRRLRKELALDDEALDDVCHELRVKRLARDDEGQALVFLPASV